jgi:DNA-binding response OmpR family regulator
VHIPFFLTEEMDVAKSEKSEKAVVLAVDDAPTVLLVIERALRKRGFDVHCAHDGPQALEMLLDIQPDLILLDVMMPRMSGFSVCERLKRSEATSGIPIIFLTGKSSTEDIVRGFRVGGVDYITKPFHPEELIARVETHVQLHQLRSILPICSYCGKIRNEEESWEPLESYVHRHAGTAFSHSICPHCYTEVRDLIRRKSPSSDS